MRPNCNMEVLVEAKKEYTNQLYDCMVPVITQSFSDMWNLSNKDVKQFQVYLQEVKHWNQSIIKEHTDAMFKNCQFFTELITAVMVAHVKILSSVRIGSEQRRISIKMPTTDLFVHHCYIHCARNVYYDPDIFCSTTISDFERETRLRERFCPCIDLTIKDLVPIQQILNTYIGSQESHADVDIGPVTDTEDPEIPEEPPEAPQEEAPQEAPQEPEKTEEEFFGDDSKWIDSGNRRMPQPPQQSSPLSSSGPGPSSMETSSPIQTSSSQPPSTQ